jgi:hypothetical protein
LIVTIRIPRRRDRRDVKPLYGGVQLPLIAVSVLSPTISVLPGVVCTLQRLGCSWLARWDFTPPFRGVVALNGLLSLKSPYSIMHCRLWNAQLLGYLLERFPRIVLRDIEELSVSLSKLAPPPRNTADVPLKQFQFQSWNPTQFWNRSGNLIEHWTSYR